jgi:membrane carboxypeptidase/penicillin-binding protein PbpC
MEIILSTAVLILIGVCIAAVKLLLNAHDQITANEQIYRTERENLINQHIKDREALARKFETDKDKLTDRLLKRNGVSPIHEEREPRPPHIIESTLTRNARLKKERESSPTIGVK